MIMSWKKKKKNTGGIRCSSFFRSLCFLFIGLLLHARYHQHTFAITTFACRKGGQRRGSSCRFGWYLLHTVHKSISITEGRVLYTQQYRGCSARPLLLQHFPLWGRRLEDQWKLSHFGGYRRRLKEKKNEKEKSSLGPGNKDQRHPILSSSSSSSFEQLSVSSHWETPSRLSDLFCLSIVQADFTESQLLLLFCCCCCFNLCFCSCHLFSLLFPFILFSYISDYSIIYLCLGKGFCEEKKEKGKKQTNCTSLTISLVAAEIRIGISKTPSSILYFQGWFNSPTTHT